MIPAVLTVPQVLQVHRVAVPAVVLHPPEAVAVPDRVLQAAVLHRAAAPVAAPHRAVVLTAVLQALQVLLTARIGPEAMASSDFPGGNLFCTRSAVVRMTMMMTHRMMTLLRMMILPAVPLQAVAPVAVPAILTATQALLHPVAAVVPIVVPVTQAVPVPQAAVAVPVLTALQVHPMTLLQAPETPVKTERN